MISNVKKFLPFGGKRGVEGREAKKLSIYIRLLRFLPCLPSNIIK